MEQPLLLLLVVSIVAMPLIMLAIMVWVLRPWLRAFLHGTPVTVFDVIGMRLRGNRASLLVDAYILLRRAGIPATIRDVETLYIDNKFQIETPQDLIELVKRNLATKQGPLSDRV